VLKAKSVWVAPVSSMAVAKFAILLLNRYALSCDKSSPTAIVARSMFVGNRSPGRAFPDGGHGLTPIPWLILTPAGVLTLIPIAVLTLMAAALSMIRADP
jgi:hypothetical protein